jgi:hypothetical protein
MKEHYRIFREQLGGLVNISGIVGYISGFLENTFCIFEEHFRIFW